MIKSGWLVYSLPQNWSLPLNECWKSFLPSRHIHHIADICIHHTVLQDTRTHSCLLALALYGLYMYSPIFFLLISSWQLVIIVLSISKQQQQQHSHYNKCEKSLQATEVKKWYWTQWILWRLIVLQILLLWQTYISEIRTQSYVCPVITSV